MPYEGRDNLYIISDEGQRCFLITVWLIGVYCTRCALCIAHSKGHWLSGSLLWDSKSISKFWGGGPNFHAFNESRQPCHEDTIFITNVTIIDCSNPTIEMIVKT